STALLHLLAATLPPRGVRLGVVHLDHGLRAESGEDARFVAGLAARLGLGLTCERADVAGLARERGLGLEEAGRSARYALCPRAGAEQGAPPVPLPHTPDDQAETLLLHLVRGAGSAGLAAMRPARDGFLRRPLLGVRRVDLMAALAARGEPYRTDPTNADP